MMGLSIVPVGFGLHGRRLFSDRSHSLFKAQFLKLHATNSFLLILGIARHRHPDVFLQSGGVLCWTLTC